MSSCLVTQATIGEHTLVTMSMYNYSDTIFSPTLYTFSFPTYYLMVNITLDRLTLYAFSFPSTVHDTIL